jgi:hypothetical protein
MPRAVLCPLVLALAAPACSSAEVTRTPPLDAGAAAPERAPAFPTAVASVYRVGVRVHTSYTAMTPEKLRSVLAETQWIWTSQASICFEFEVVADDVEAETGFDVWYYVEVPEAPGVNGWIEDGGRIGVLDQPALHPARRPAREPAARTTAHELGHGLGLDHYQEPHDLSESLMASKQAGYALHDFEIARARETAGTLGVKKSAAYACAPPLAD